MKRGSRGFGLVELMVGSAIGLFVIALACSAAGTQLQDQRQQQMAAQVDEEMRAVADLIARDLRRAGYWSQASRQVSAGASVVDPYASLQVGDGLVRYAYSQEDGPAADSADYAGVRLQSGVVQLLSGDGGWQPLSDPATLQVKSLRVALQVRTVDLASACPSPCKASAQPGCPRQQVRSATIDLAGTAAADPRIARTLRVLLRVRNDEVDGACPP